MAEDNPAYKCVELRFGDAAVVLRGDGSLDGNMEAFTTALETINPQADDVAFAVGWLVANQARQAQLLRDLSGEDLGA